MKKTMEQRRIKIVISIVVIIAIVFSIGFFYNNIQEKYNEYIIVENKPNPKEMQKRIVVLENCESEEKLTKEVLNRTTYAISYKEGKIIKIKR